MIISLLIVLKVKKIIIKKCKYSLYWILNYFINV